MSFTSCKEMTAETCQHGTPSSAGASSVVREKALKAAIALEGSGLQSAESARRFDLSPAPPRSPSRRWRTGTCCGGRWDEGWSAVGRQPQYL